MKLSYKYRIFPNRTQGEVLQKVFYFCRFLYNSALQERNTYYKKYGKGIYYEGQAAELNVIKQEFPNETSTIYSQTLQQVLKKLERSFENFFRRVKLGENPGYPRFKGPNSKNTICFPQSDLSGFGVKLVEGKLEVFGIPGEIKVKFHRPFEGKVKQVMLSKQHNKYYLILTCAGVPNKPLPKTDKSIGIDLGITPFATLDNGITYNSPKPYKTAKEKLAYLQRKLANKKKLNKNILTF